MKPPPFDYEAPESLDEALSLMDKFGADAKILAGGQSLIPALNFRSLQPKVIVDINRLSQLEYVTQLPTADVHIGAMTRQGVLEFDPIIEEYLPLMHYAIPFIAHTAIRNRGTIGGSLAYADPAGEQPTLTTALNADFKLQSLTGERWVSAGDFFKAMNKTVLKSNEILTEIRIPTLPERTGWAFREVSRRHGDRVMMGVAALVTTDANGTCRQVKLVFQNGASIPLDAVNSAQLLVGENGASIQKVIQAAAAKAAHEEIEPVGDVHTSQAFQRQLAHELTLDVLAQAYQKATSVQEKD